MSVVGILRPARALLGARLIFGKTRKPTPAKIGEHQHRHVPAGLHSYLASWASPNGRAAGDSGILRYASAQAGASQIVRAVGEKNIC